MRWKRGWLTVLCGLLLLFLLLFCASTGSLPCLSGNKTLSGLIQPVHLIRDQYGIPTIQGGNRLDIARATGFLHAQERFFQMDLMRRAAAGELSELFGSATIEYDKERRLHCFRRQAQLILPTLNPFEKEILKAYVEGVNTGLNALHCRPFEYFILREAPAVWKEEDSILVGLGLFFDLQDPLGSTDWMRGILQASLPTAVYEFFTKNGSIWDAPLDQSSIPMISIPDARHFAYLADNKDTIKLNTKNSLPSFTKGSNQWAIHASLTAKQRPILACDMHLNLLVPNIWYRLSIDQLDEGGKRVQVNGVSLPGTPLMVVGSNGHIAWGFTNAYIDTTDLVLLDGDPSKDLFYLAPEGRIPFEERIEEIKIKGHPSTYYKIPWTQWGPVHPKTFLGKRVAIRWIAHDVDCFNFGLINLETTISAEDALQSLSDIHIPVLNFMVADRKGHIGWSFVGGIPKRLGYQPGLPVSFTTGDCQWIRHWNQKEYPILLDPPDKCLWTANNRTLHNPLLGRDYLNGIRAYQIHKRLIESNHHTLADMYAMQLDDEAFFFDRWYELLAEHLDLNNVRQQQLYSIIKQWDHHCAASSQGYFWIRTFREMIINRISERLFAPCFLTYPDLNIHLLDLEEPIYLIASQQPAYLVNPDFGSWKGEFFQIIEDMLDSYQEQLAKKSPWGSFNVSLIQHPLSQALSFLGFLLDMPKIPLSGDYYVPRVASQSDGASVRFVISPGHEEEGILNMPCGQSGHPLSRHYRDQHTPWAEGIPTSFLPGPPESELLLVP